MAAYRPEGYNAASAYIIADGAQRVIEFLRAVFDAEPLRRYDREDGSIMHSEVRIDDTVVMIADSLPGWPAAPAALHVYVPDVDATYARALAAGGTSLQEPAHRDGDPDRRGGVKDPAGNSWWVATQVE